MAEGAPLLREYGANTSSRVRIPPSPPISLSSARRKKRVLTVAKPAATFRKPKNARGPTEFWGQSYESYGVRAVALTPLLSLRRSRPHRKPFAASGRHGPVIELPVSHRAAANRADMRHVVATGIGGDILIEPTQSIIGNDER